MGWPATRVWFHRAFLHHTGETQSQAKEGQEGEVPDAGGGSGEEPEAAEGGNTTPDLYNPDTTLFDRVITLRAQ